MLLVGLTGGLASGKSFVGNALQNLGCHLIRADELGHQALAPDGEAYQQVVKEFGNHILSEDGTINRRALAADVFQYPDRLAVLNGIIHPVVRAREASLVQEIQASDPNPIVVVEAAIHIETGGHKRFRPMILAVCRPEQQIERAMRRDGLTEDEVRARLARQMPLEEKKRYADYIVDTSGEKLETLRQTAEVYNSLKRLLNESTV